MNRQEKCRELFGSLSEDSDSLPASPPPRAWPPPVDPKRRRRIPRKGTKIQRGDSSRDRHTSWLMETPPAPPKASRKSAATGQSGPKGKTASGRNTITDMATPGGSATAMPASGSQAKMADGQPPRAKGRTTSGSGAKIKPPRVDTSGQPGITDPVKTTTNKPAEGKASGSGQKPTRDRQVAESATRKPAVRPPDVPATPPATFPSTVPLIVPPPTPPAYLRRDGWISRPGKPLAIPIQLPDGTCISVPMSAIRHNRKWRARTATGRWILRFATDGRLTMCRKVTEVTLD
ncbi:hypothetical protein PUN28_020807 [Cardiocondyla obscurior]|uniref:Uncharacterized protein n=1 Tax=Cardiocondyla obscurior TaxID=286306 RepID=A0AAW2E6J3_9HYME